MTTLLVIVPWSLPEPLGSPQRTKEKLGESGDLVGREVLKELNAKIAANRLNL